MENYIFKSERLGFRNWTEKDNTKMGMINSDPKVMEHFPTIPTQKQTEWGKGFATEGAKKCLEFAFNEVGLKNIKSICPETNDKSE